MKRTALVIAAVALCGCVVPRQPIIQDSMRQKIDNLVVTEADLSVPYRILGPVTWPEDARSIRFNGPGLWGYGGYECEPYKVAAAAVNRYGASADAVIGVIKTKPGRKQEQCRGTVVSFTAR